MIRRGWELRKLSTHNVIAWENGWQIRHWPILPQPDIRRVVTGWCTGLQRPEVPCSTERTIKLTLNFY